LQIINNTYIHTVKSDVKDFLDVEVGDIKQVGFYPQMKVKRWDNEVNFSARLMHDEINPVVSQANDKVSFVGEKIESHFYGLDPSDNLPEGGFEFNVYLKEKPATNKVRFSLQTKGLRFENQPPLTQFIKTGWSDHYQKYIKLVLDTIAIAEDGSVVSSRPRNIVNSIAVFYDNCPLNYIDGKLYRAGKVGHILMPLHIDAEGKTAYAEKIEIDEKKEFLEVTIPQDFIDNAVYPIRHAAGLTFGYETIGASVEFGIPANYSSIYKSPNTPASNGTLTALSIYAYVPSGTATIYPAFYSDGNGSTNTLLAGSWGSNGATATTIEQWVDMTLSYSSIASGTQYYLASGSATAFRVRYDSDASAYAYYKSGTSFPTPYAGSAHNGYKYSFYATYTASGSTQISISDSGAGDDVLSILNKLSLSDTGAGADVAALLNRFTLSENGAGVDDISLLIKALIEDTGIGSDTIALLIKSLIEDTATAEDLLSVFVKTIISDSGIGDDAVSKSEGIIHVLIPDTGAAEEAIAIYNKLLLTDSGTGTDELLIKAILTVLDTGTGIDVIRVLTSIIEYARLTAEVRRLNQIEAEVSIVNQLCAEIRIYNDLEGEVV
jgi:hypothetical protein